MAVLDLPTYSYNPHQVYHWDQGEWDCLHRPGNGPDSSKFVEFLCHLLQDPPPLCRAALLGPASKPTRFVCCIPCCQDSVACYRLWPGCKCSWIHHFLPPSGS